MSAFAALFGCLSFKMEHRHDGRTPSGFKSRRRSRRAETAARWSTPTENSSGSTTFRYEDGPADNLHYAISATHLKKLMATAGTKVQPLSPQKPKPTLTIEPYVPNPTKGDPEKTLAAWKQYGERLSELNDTLATCQQRLDKIPHLDSRVRMGLQSGQQKSRRRFAI